MKSEPFIASKAFDLGNLGVIAPHKAKYLTATVLIG